MGVGMGGQESARRRRGTFSHLEMEIRMERIKVTIEMDQVHATMSALSSGVSSIFSS